MAAAAEGRRDDGESGGHSQFGSGAHIDAVARDAPFACRAGFRKNPDHENAREGTLGGDAPMVGRTRAAVLPSQTSECAIRVTWLPTGGRGPGSGGGRMSGPKGHRVRVVSQIELDRRERTELVARCRVLSSRLESLRALGVSGIPEVRVDHGATLATLRGLATTFAEAVEAAATRHAAAVALARYEAMRAHLAEFTVPDGTDGRSILAPLQAAEASSAASLEGLLARASEVDDVAVAARLKAQAMDVSMAAGPRRARAMQALEVEVAQAVKADRVRRRVLDEAARLVLTIAHLDGDGAEAVRERAATARTQHDLAAVRTQVGQLRVEATKSDDAVFVTEQTRAVLVELGYEVGEPFEPVEHAGTVMLARSPGLPSHAVQLRVGADAGTLLASVVATDVTTRAADVEAERETCADLLALPRALAERGVTAERVFHREIGAVAVERAQTRPEERTARPRRLGGMTNGLAR